jgi:hypothetical protein
MGAVAAVAFFWSSVPNSAIPGSCPLSAHLPTKNYNTPSPVRVFALHIGPFFSLFGYGTAPFSAKQASYYKII